MPTFLLQCMSPVVAQPGSASEGELFPLTEVERTNSGEFEQAAEDALVANGKRAAEGWLR
jgi:hypothetical protein